MPLSVSQLVATRYNLCSGRGSNLGFSTSPHLMCMNLDIKLLAKKKKWDFIRCRCKITLYYSYQRKVSFLSSLFLRLVTIFISRISNFFIFFIQQVISNLLRSRIDSFLSSWINYPQSIKGWCRPHQ